MSRKWALTNTCPADGVGKSSIITSLIKESFVSNVSTPSSTALKARSLVHQLTNILQQVQHVVPEVTIPPEVTPENVTTTIVDTSCTSCSDEACHATDT